MSSHDPLDQLSRLRIEVDPGVRLRHLDAIDAELRRLPRRGRDSRWTLGVVVAMLLAGPVSAVASDRAVPGDLLYPLKQMFEPIVAVVDPGVVAEHRVEEVGELVRRGSEETVIEARVAVARDALGDDPVLQRELDRIVDAWSGDRRSAEIDEAVPTSTTAVEPSTPETIDGQRRDIPPSVTPTSGADVPIDSDAPPPDRTTTSTTESTGDGGRLPPTDAPRDRP